MELVTIWITIMGLSVIGALCGYMWGYFDGMRRGAEIARQDSREEGEGL